MVQEEDTQKKVTFIVVLTFSRSGCGVFIQVFSPVRGTKLKEVYMIIREYREADIPAMAEIWNEVVREGTAFPQEEELDDISGGEFFGTQSYSGVAENDSGEICGLYILHPNNVGRCGHICNASYAVASGLRGQHIGEALVKDCICQAGKLGFRILQFNAVVESNLGARHLYEKLGVTQLGVIPGGFRTDGGEYVNIFIYYYLIK